jgi:hypothetical protein
MFWGVVSGLVPDTCGSVFVFCLFYVVRMHHAILNHTSCRIQGSPEPAVAILLGETCNSVGRSSPASVGTRAMRPMRRRGLLLLV